LVGPGGTVGPVAVQEPREPSRLVGPGGTVGPVAVPEPREPSRLVGPGEQLVQLQFRSLGSLAVWLDQENSWSSCSSGA
jgi:hypothetical protein